MRLKRAGEARRGAHQAQQQINQTQFCFTIDTLSPCGDRRFYGFLGRKSEREKRYINYQSIHRSFAENWWITVNNRYCGGLMCNYRRMRVVFRRTQFSTEFPTKGRPFISKAKTPRHEACVSLKTNFWIYGRHLRCAFYIYNNHTYAELHNHIDSLFHYPFLHQLISLQKIAATREEAINNIVRFCYSTEVVLNGYSSSPYFNTRLDNLRKTELRRIFITLTNV